MTKSIATIFRITALKQISKLLVLSFVVCGSVQATTLKGLNLQSSPTSDMVEAVSPIANIAALQALTAAQLDTPGYVFLSGGVTANDGLGGPYLYIAGSCVDNGSTIIKSTGPGWCWYKQGGGGSSAASVANVATLRATFATAVPTGGYIELASYYAAAGAAPDGGGGILQEISGTCTDDGMLTFEATVTSQCFKRFLNGANLTALQAGAHNGATDSTAQLQAAVNLGIPIDIPAGVTITCTSGNVLMPNFSSLLGPGGGAYGTANLNMGGNFLQLNGFFIVIDGLIIQGTNADVLIYATGLNLQFTKITNSSLFNFSGPVVQLNAQLNNFLFFNNIVQGSSYGFLYNDNGNAGNDLILIGNSINTTGDPIEINSPTGTGLRDIIITGNDLTSSNSFGVGIANAHNYTITGNYINSGGEGIHIEDSQYGGVISGNTIVAIGQAKGINILNDNTNNGQAVTVVGNTIRNQSTATASSVTVASGVMTVGGTITGAFTVGMGIGGAGFDPNTFISSLGTGTGGAGTYNLGGSTGTISSPVAVTGGGAGITTVNNGVWVPNVNISENTIDGFPVCAYLNGPTNYGFQDNLLQNCYNGIVSDYTIRAVGVTRMHNVQVGAQAAAASQIGKIIWDDNSAVSIVKKRGTGIPGITLEGFADAAIPLTISGSGSQTATISPACGLMYGRMRTTIGNGGTSNGVFRESSILYPGSGSSIEVASTIIDNDVGALAGAAPTVSGGNITANFTSTGALSSYLLNADFAGTCYQP